LATYTSDLFPIRIFGDLTPCVPLSLIRRGGRFLKEGLTPLLNTLTLLTQNKESQREAKPLLYIHSPFPLSRGRGIKGDGVSK